MEQAKAIGKYVRNVPKKLRKLRKARKAYKVPLPGNVKYSKLENAVQSKFVNDISTKSSRETQQAARHQVHSSRRNINEASDEWDSDFSEDYSASMPNLAYAPSELDSSARVRRYKPANNSAMKSRKKLMMSNRNIHVSMNHLEEPLQLYEQFEEEHDQLVPDNHGVPSSHTVGNFQEDPILHRSDWDAPVHQNRSYHSCSFLSDTGIAPVVDFSESDGVDTTSSEPYVSTSIRITADQWKLETFFAVVKVGRIKKLAIRLGLSWIEIQSSCYRNSFDQKLEILHKWYQREGYRYPVNEVIAIVNKTVEDLEVVHKCWFKGDVYKDNDLYTTAENIAVKWQTIAFHLKVDSTKIENYQDDSHLNRTIDQAMQMLVEWRESFHSKAECQMGAIFEAFEKCKTPTELFSDMCTVLLNNTDYQLYEDDANCQNPTIGQVVSGKFAGNTEIIVKYCNWQGLSDFSSEYHILKSFKSHPNIATFCGVIIPKEPTDNFALVIEHPAYGSYSYLRNTLKVSQPNAMFPTELILSAFLHPAAGLKFLHTRIKRIIHGKISPKVICLAADFQWKITEFEEACFYYVAQSKDVQPETDLQMYKETCTAMMEEETFTRENPEHWHIWQFREALNVVMTEQKAQKYSVGEAFEKLQKEPTIQVSVENIRMAFSRLPLATYIPESLSSDI